MTPDSRPSSPHGVLELRVLAGTLAGARVVKDASQPVDVGIDAACDVVLHGAGLPPDFRWTFRVRDPNSVWLRVAHGPLWAGNHELPPNEDIAWPLYAPLRLGDTALAIGRPDAAEWHAEPDRKALPSADMTSPGRRPRRQTWTVGIGIAATVFCLGLWAFASVAQPPAPRPHRAPAPAHRLDPPSDNLLAQAVQDVFRTHAINADVQILNHGAAIVTTHTGDTVRLDAAKAAALRDVRGVSAIEVRDTPPAATDTGPPVNDPGKRVTAIVPGDAPYVVTADGSRYFEGAVLPTGHRIAVIREREVVLERGNTISPLHF